MSSVLARMRGETVDTLSTSTGGMEYYVNRTHNGFSEVPLGRQVLATAGPRRLFVCTNHDARCLAFDTAGLHRGTFTIDVIRHEVSAKDWELARRRLVDVLPLRDERELRAGVLKEISAPSHFPLIDEIQADSRDRLWVRTFTDYGSQYATWLVLASSGRPLFHVHVPANLRILEIGDSHLLGLVLDRDGVERVELHPLRLPTP